MNDEGYVLLLLQPRICHTVAIKRRSLEAYRNLTVAFPYPPEMSHDSWPAEMHIFLSLSSSASNAIWKLGKDNCPLAFSEEEQMARE